MEEKATRVELAALLAKMRSGNGPATVEEDAHTGTCALSLGSDLTSGWSGAFTV